MASTSHNAHLFETVTVYYRWHPLCDQSLRVYQRKKEHTTVCQLANGSTLSIPSWMLNPECTQFSFGPPEISVEALMQLRNLLCTLQLASTCDKSSLTPAREEGVDEAKDTTNHPAIQSVAGERTGNSDLRRQAKRTQTRPGRVTSQRRLSRGRNRRPPKRRQ